MLKLGFLGGFRAERGDGTQVSFASRKAQGLLAYLAIESRRAQPRELLASLLWGNTGDDRARHNLRQSVAHIRSELGPLIASDGDCLFLDSAGCETDVGAFLEFSGADDCDSLCAALDAYQGDLLQGVNFREPEFCDWLRLSRNRLRQAACDTATRLAEQQVADGRPERAIDALNALLEVDQANESAHRDLMNLYAETGKRTRALQQYQSCVDALKRELGVTPDDETRQIYARIGATTEAEQGGQTGISVDSGTVPAVAVLPFDNLSGPDSVYFADGIAEDLITALSSFNSLAVISRGTSFQFRDRDAAEQDIARRIGAQYLVRGSVRRADNRVRINVQLMDAGQGLQVWGNRYDRQMEDVFALQDEIVSTLVSTLAGRVEAARLSHARKAAPERLDAYDLVLRGKDHHHRFTADDCRLCIDMFLRAIDRDPSYAVAHAWLACGYGQAIVFRLDEAPKLVDLSQAAAERGLELDENESECHRVLAQVQLTRRNLDRSMYHQDRALFLNPNDDRILCAQGEILTFVGRAEEGLDWVCRAMRLNPYHPVRYWTHRARALFHLGRDDDTLAALANIDRVRADDLAYRSAALWRLGDEQAAAACMTELLATVPGFDPTACIDDMPYTDEDYRQALGEPLRAAFDKNND
jgi:TolB-like protein/Tfp pilus assembly protein PilF